MCTPCRGPGLRLILLFSNFQFVSLVGNRLECFIAPNACATRSTCAERCFHRDWSIQIARLPTSVRQRGHAALGKVQNRPSARYVNMNSLGRRRLLKVQGSRSYPLILALFDSGPAWSLRGLPGFLPLPKATAATHCQQHCGSYCMKILNIDRIIALERLQATCAAALEG